MKRQDNPSTFGAARKKLFLPMLCLAPSNPNFAGTLDKMMRADLDAWSSFWFWILIASTIMVVIGIICEAPEIWQTVGLGRKTVEHVREFWYVRVRRTDLNGWERLCPELITKTRHNRKWVATIGFIGWAFVALGVAGEGVSEYFVNDAETNIRAFDESLLADAQRKTAFAIERASENEREAAQLRTDAEGMKAENLRLEATVQPRTISLEDRKKLGTELLPFSQSLKGRKIKVSSLMGDAEGMLFGLEIIDTLVRARIDVDVSGMGTAMWVGWVQTGVKITGNGNDEQFISKLAKGINSSAGTDVFAEWNPKYSEILVFVGAKPIPGLPSQPPISQQRQKNSAPRIH